MIQSGPLPCFLTEEQLEKLITGNDLSESEQQFVDGVDVLGLVHVRLLNFEDLNPSCVTEVKVL